MKEHMSIIRKVGETLKKVFSERSEMKVGAQDKVLAGLERHYQRYHDEDRKVFLRGAIAARQRREAARTFNDKGLLNNHAKKKVFPKAKQSFLGKDRTMKQGKSGFLR